MNYKLNEKVQFCFFVIIEAILCFTVLGSIPIGPIVATLSLIPVIILSLYKGAKWGMLLGFVMAVFCLIYWTFVMPAYPTAFIWTPFSQMGIYKGNYKSLIICFVPRMLTGLIPAIIVAINKKFLFNENIVYVIASAIGSLTNTIFVVLFIFLFYKVEYEAVTNTTFMVLIKANIMLNGIIEALISAVVCPVVCKVLNKLKNH